MSVALASVPLVGSERVLAYAGIGSPRAVDDIKLNSRSSRLDSTTSPAIPREPLLAAKEDGCDRGSGSSEDDKWRAEQKLREREVLGQYLE